MPDSPFDPETIQARLATCDQAGLLNAGLANHDYPRGNPYWVFVHQASDPSTGYAAALKEIQALRTQLAQAPQQESLSINIQDDALAIGHALADAIRQRERLDLLMLEIMRALPEGNMATQADYPQMIRELVADLASTRSALRQTQGERDNWKHYGESLAAQYGETITVDKAEGKR